jgi:hypothetical protein
MSQTLAQIKWWCCNPKQKPLLLQQLAVSDQPRPSPTKGAKEEENSSFLISFALFASFAVKGFGWLLTC